MALQRAVYRPRDAEHTMLHQVVAEHLEAFNGKGSGTIAAALSRPPFDDDILAFDVSLIP
jgi:hypothetical protein